MNNQHRVKPHPAVVALSYETFSKDTTSKCPYIPEPTEPSMFTRGEGALHPRWVKWFMTKFGLSHQMAVNIGTALYSHLLKEPRREIDPLAPEPSPMLEDVALVSMAFVMHYKHKHNVSYTQAYEVGYSLVALQSGDPDFMYHDGAHTPEPLLMDRKA